jgi:hypothetical protein
MAPPARGLLGAIKDFFSGGKAGDEGAPVPAAAKPSAGRRLRGRIAVQGADLLVIEVFADGAALAWAPAGEARITLADGQVVVARIDPGRTTKAGAVAAGAAARLSLALPAGASLDVVREVQIELSGATVTIEV